jgi:subtilase family serine protease
MSSVLRRVCVAAASIALLTATLSTSSLASVPNATRAGTQKHHLWTFASKTAPPTTADCVSGLDIACYAPFQLQRAYDLRPLFRHGLDGSGSTIAIVDSFGSPTIRHDLRKFDRDFGLPAPPSLRIIHPAGAIPPYDASSDRVGWAFETTLDVEWAHTFAPGARILLVETPVSETQGVQGFPQIVRAENYVINHGLADVITQSFGTSEQDFPNAATLRSFRGAYRNARRHDVTVLASSGDSGATGFTLDSEPIPHRAPQWPASDPLVTSVGGTQLHLNAHGRRTAQDNVWNDTFNPNVVGPTPSPAAGGSGRSTVFKRPWYQDGLIDQVHNHRGYPDVSLSAAVDGGVLVFLSFDGIPTGYYIVGGTSEASPEFAGIVAIADQAAGRMLGLLNPALYGLQRGGAPGIVDIRRGNNNVQFTDSAGTHNVRGFRAGPGFDLASGLGTVDAAKLVWELASP